MAPEELAKNFVPQLSAHKLRLLKKIFVDFIIERRTGFIMNFYRH